MKHIKKITATLLSALLILSVFAGCSGKKGNISKIMVSLPAASEAEQAMNATASLAVDYYLTARVYLDKIAFYDTENMDKESAKDFVGTLTKAVETFEISEQLAGALSEAADTFEKSSYTQKPTLKTAQIGTPSFELGLTAFAADDGGAKKWAQDIVDAYDAAPSGKGIRTLAEQLGTDSKHAYAQLKQALAVLEGAEYTAIADKANTAVQVATGLKAAGTAAGLVIAVAAAPATTTIGAIAQTGGIVCSGINTVLEVGTAGSIIYNNGEEDEIAIALQKTEAQFAPIGQVFSIMGLGTGLKDIGETGKKILEGGYKSLTPKEAQDLGENAFGVISYVASSVSDYVNDGSLLSGTFVKNEKGGMDFKLFQTMLGWDDQQVKDFLNDDSDFKTLEDSLNQISEAYKSANGALVDSATPSERTDENTDSKPENESKSDTKEDVSEPDTPVYDGNIPDEVGEKIIERTSKKTNTDDFDIKAYIDRLRAVLYELAGLNEDESKSETETETQTQTEPVTDKLTTEMVAGTYNVSGTANLTGERVHFENGKQSKDYAATVEVTANSENSLGFKITSDGR
ncbi:MAG: hypothetical protein J5877_00750, partial [Clostridia bacterium]|nr:hypothetical protein [Clostridia bacterium]